MKRRHLWLAAALIFVGLCTPLAAIADAPAGGAAQPPTAADRDGQAVKKYTATALLLLSMQPPHLVFPSIEREGLPEFDICKALPSTEREGLPEFDAYKATQEQLVKSQYVLNAALRDQKVRGLPTIQREEKRRRAVSWLTSQLRVSFPGRDSEVMTVSVTGPDPKEAATLVNAVVGAYMREVVDAERNQRVVRRNELDKICADKENEVRCKKNDLKQIAEQLGVAESAASGATEQRLAMERALASEKELARLRSDLRLTRGGLEVQKELGARCKRLEIQAKVLEDMMQECQEESEQFARQAKRLSVKSLDVEMLSAEVRRGEEILNAVAREREKVRIELHAAPRVTVLQSAEVPETPDEPGKIGDE